MKKNKIISEYMASIGGRGGRKMTPLRLTVLQRNAAWARMKRILGIKIRKAKALEHAAEILFLMQQREKKINRTRKMRVTNRKK